ncbi:MAG TPA: Hsp70 family protein [Myxococcales bacterium]|jgi:molecular chaperone DnaK (HSP70)|nr:Hsp70 family protein [Myxococcales bacterium]
MRRAVFAILLAAACKKEARPPSLGEAISVEQPGGSASQLFSQGSEIPTGATESFTTAKENDKRIYVHVLRGAGRTAAALHSDGWWEVDGVSPGAVGEPRVMVTFELDAQGQLSLTAREEDRRLAVKKLDGSPAKAAPSPLTEPDDDEDVEEDPPE